MLKYIKFIKLITVFDNDFYINLFVQLFKGILFGSFLCLLCFNNDSVKLNLTLILIDLITRLFFSSTNLESLNNFIHLQIDSITLFKFFILDGLLSICNFIYFSFFLIFSFYFSNDNLDLILIITIGNSLFERAIRLVEKKSFLLIALISAFYLLTLILNAPMKPLWIISIFILKTIFIYKSYKKFISIWFQNSHKRKLKCYLGTDFLYYTQFLD